MNLYSVNLPNGSIHLSSVNEVNQKVSALLRDAQASSRELPGAPWCAILPEPSVMAEHPSAAEWLGDLADGLARAWLARKALLGSFQGRHMRLAAGAPAAASLCH